MLWLPYAAGTRVRKRTQKQLGRTSGTTASPQVSAIWAVRTAGLESACRVSRARRAGARERGRSARLDGRLVGAAEPHREPGRGAGRVLLRAPPVGERLDQHQPPPEDPERVLVVRDRDRGGLARAGRSAQVPDHHGQNVVIEVEGQLGAG